MKYHEKEFNKDINRLEKIIFIIGSVILGILLSGSIFLNISGLNDWKDYVGFIFITLLFSLLTAPIGGLLSCLVTDNIKRSYFIAYSDAQIDRSINEKNKLLSFLDNLNFKDYPNLMSLSDDDKYERLKNIKKIIDEDSGEMIRQYLTTYENISKEESLKKLPNEPFLALTTTKGGEYYGLFFVNPTKNYYLVKQLTGAFASGDDDVVETSKRVSILPELYPESFTKIEDIHYTERDFVIWYEFDMTEKGGNVLYKRGGISKSYRYNEGDKVFIDYGLKQEAWIEELKDRPNQESIDEITKTMNMDSRHIIFNEDGSIKEEIS